MSEMGLRPYQQKEKKVTEVVVLENQFEKKHTTGHFDQHVTVSNFHEIT